MIHLNGKEAYLEMIRPPATAFSLLLRSFRHVLPRSKQHLQIWHEHASRIPNPELRLQALASLTSKRFHADGGSVYATAAVGAGREVLIRLIVAFQTISDYLDNLCDRSTSLDPVDFRQLHQAMLDAVTPGAPLQDYYRYREDRDDDGYLATLVTTCRECIDQLPGYAVAMPYVQHLVGLYCDLQVHKHVRHDERVGRLTAWFGEQADPVSLNWQAGPIDPTDPFELTDPPELSAPSLDWWEFSAATGSTLGVFTYFLTSLDPAFDETHAQAIQAAYFPWVGGLHILLDYLIDQEEDRLGGDLNFVEYYPSPARAYERIVLFAKRSLAAVESLPDHHFHRLVVQGLIGMYLSDPKITGDAVHSSFAKDLTRQMGRTASLFHWVSRYYRRKYHG